MEPAPSPPAPGHVEAWTGRVRAATTWSRSSSSRWSWWALSPSGLAMLFSSPDDAAGHHRRMGEAGAGRLRRHRRQRTRRHERVASYGPPYTNTPDAAQKIRPICLQCCRVTASHRHAQRSLSGRCPRSANDPAMARRSARYRAAGRTSRRAWATHTATRCRRPPTATLKVAAGDYGPVPRCADLLDDGAGAAASTALLATQAVLPNRLHNRCCSSPTASYLRSQARGREPLGDQWGMMNETGDCPGQAWLWLYTFWYQVPPFNTSDNADALVWGLMMLLTAGLVLLPFIPGLRSIPRWMPVYRLIWRTTTGRWTTDGRRHATTAAE